jgi:malonate transporter and related proteins
LHRRAEAEGLARVNHKRVYRVMKRAGLLLEPHTGRGLVSTIRPPAAAQILQADQARAHSVLQAPRHLGRGGRRGGRGAARAASPRRETPLPVVLDVILPIFGLLAFGYGATFTRVFGEAAASALASFVFYFAIPVMLFRSMATAALPDQIPWGYLGAFYGGAVVAFGLGFGIARLAFEGPFERHAIIGFGAAFGNSVLLGVPVVLTALGDAASLPLFLLLAFHSTLLFTTITLVLEIGGAGRERLRDVPAKALGGLARNPILWGLAGGIAVNLLGLRLPAALARWTELVAGAAVPCALFSTGASLRSYRIAGALRPALVMVALKLVVCPLAVWALATMVFEMPPLWAKVAIVLAAMPVGVNVYLFGVRYHAGEAESATAVLLSSILSLASLSLVLVWLHAGVP